MHLAFVRERTAEAEKEIERQRLLELERTKTRELRHNLDMEKERQTQVKSLVKSICVGTFNKNVYFLYALCCMARIHGQNLAKF